MHKLRLRSRSAAQRERETPQKEQPQIVNAGGYNNSTIIGNSQQTISSKKGKGKEREKSSFKASIRHVGADNSRNGATHGLGLAPAAGACSSSQTGDINAKLRPQLSLPAGNDFRTSLILPELTRRFTLLRGKDGSLVPLNQMQAHLRIQRENGKLTESEEEMVLRQYRLQSIYEASQPQDYHQSNIASMPSFSSSPYRKAHSPLPHVQEETASMHSQSRAPSRAAYTPDPDMSSPGASYSPFFGMPSPQPMTASSSSASSHTSTPTPVSTGFASSSAAEFYAARDAVMKGNSLFGGGGLEREVISQMSTSKDHLASSIGTTDTLTSARRSRYRRYNNTSQQSRTFSDTSSQHSQDGNESSISSSPGSMRNRVRSPIHEYIPPVPKIQKPQEEEYDPFRPKDSDEGHNSYNMQQEQVVPPHLDLPMSKKQFNRISKALLDIEAELTKSYSFIDPLVTNGEAAEDMQERGTVLHRYEEYEFSPSEEGDHDGSYGFVHDGDHTFHSSTSESNSSEYHHQHSSRAPFVYDDTEEIDPPLSRLPSVMQTEEERQLGSLGEEAESDDAGEGHVEGVDQEQPRLQLEGEEYEDDTGAYAGLRSPSAASSNRDDMSRLSDSTGQSSSTAIPGGSRSVTNSTSTLGAVFELGSSSTQNLLSVENPRHSGASDISKALSSPGLSYLQATPPAPVQSAQFTSQSTMEPLSSAIPTSGSSLHSMNGSTAMQPSLSTHSIASMASGRSQHSIGGSISNLPRHLRESFSPAHSRNDSGSSSIHGPPLSPPPSCGLPPLPDSTSSLSLASLGRDSLEHQQQPSQSMTRSMSTSDSLASITEAETSQRALSPIASMKENEEQQESQHVAFPSYPKHDVPSFHDSENSHEAYRKGSVSDMDSESDHHRYSTTSAGSSWRGGPGHARNLSTSTVDFELSNLPLSPSKTTHRMTGIEEDEDEERQEYQRTMEGEEARAYLEEHGAGLNMSDLRAIQERLMQSALQLRGNGEEDYVEALRQIDLRQEHTPALKDEPANYARRDSLQPDSEVSQAGSEDPVALKLGSPFMEQNGFESLPVNEETSSAVESSLPQRRESEQSSSHNEVAPVQLSSKAESHHSNSQESSSNGTHVEYTHEETPRSTTNASASPFASNKVPAPTSVPRQPVPALDSSPTLVRSDAGQSPSPSTLRARPTRNSNSTPSMLIRHVHQQATEATAALKSQVPPASQFSPDEALRRVANNPARRTLSHRKSAKSLRIGSPQLLSSSANLEAMPMVETQPYKSPSTSPEMTRKASMSGLRFNMLSRSKKVHGNIDDEDYNPGSADSSNASGNFPSPLHSSRKSHAHNTSFDNSPSNGIRNLMSRLRRRKVSNETPDRLIPDPLVLSSPQWSSPKELHSPLYSNRDSLQNRFNPGFKAGTASVSSNGTAGMADVSPLNLMNKIDAAKNASYSSMANGSDSPSFGHLALTPDGREKGRSSATSLDSMRKLYEAATALGLEPDKVNELVDAAGYRQAKEKDVSPDSNPVVRSTVILPPADDSYFPRMSQIGQDMARSSSTSALQRRPATNTTGNHESPTRAQVDITNGSSAHMRRAASQGTYVSDINIPGRRSVHDRPPTPPPAKAAHRRQKSEVLVAENPLPPLASVIKASPPPPVAWPLESTKSAASSLRARNTSANSEELALPMPPFSRAAKDSRSSMMSSKTSGSYDARSIYGLYADDDEEIPPTPGLKDLNMVLASGRIPASSTGAQRASLLLAPGVSAKRLSTASRHSRIELAEYANGDIAFNIVQSLRRAPGSGEGDRGTFYPTGLHYRQDSQNSVEEELNDIAASSISSPAGDADPLKLMIKRHLKEHGSGNHAELEAIAHLQQLSAERQKRQSQALSASSGRSVFEVYEATDENQVAALIEELTKGLDEGHFNLSRTGTISNSPKRAAHRANESSTSNVFDVQATPRATLDGPRRTPSKVKRQPPPTI